MRHRGEAVSAGIAALLAACSAAPLNAVPAPDAASFPPESDAGPAGNGGGPDGSRDGGAVIVDALVPGGPDTGPADGAVMVDAPTLIKPGCEPPRCFTAFFADIAACTWGSACVEAATPGGGPGVTGTIAKCWNNGVKELSTIGSGEGGGQSLSTRVTRPDGLTLCYTSDGQQATEIIGPAWWMITFTDGHGVKVGTATFRKDHSVRYDCPGESKVVPPSCSSNDPPLVIPACAQGPCSL